MKEVYCLWWHNNNDCESGKELVGLFKTRAGAIERIKKQFIHRIGDNGFIREFVKSYESEGYKSVNDLLQAAEASVNKSVSTGLFFIKVEDNRIEFYCGQYYTDFTYEVEAMEIND